MSLLSSKKFDNVAILFYKQTAQNGTHRTLKNKQGQIFLKNSNNLAIWRLGSRMFQN